MRSGRRTSDGGHYDRPMVEAVNPFLGSGSLFGSGPGWALTEDEPFVVDGVTFVMTYGPGSSADRFSLIKTPTMLDLYRSLRSEIEGGRVFEIGIAEGGSTAWMALELAPATLIAVDIATEHANGLDELIDARDLGAVIRPHWGVDQSDRARLHEIVRAELDGELLDVVIDDASHLLEPSRASFDALFPFLCPGGRYVIEDWNWEHRNADMWSTYFNDPDAPDHAERQAHLAARLEDSANWLTNVEPLSKIAVELMLACASFGEVFADVSINEYWIDVRRGPAPLDPATFHLADHVNDLFGLLGPPVPPT